MYFFNSVFNKLVYYYYNFYLFLSVHQTDSLLSLVKNDDRTAGSLIVAPLNNCRVCVDFFLENFLVCLRINYLLRVLREGLLVKINLKITGHLRSSGVFYYRVLVWYERKVLDMFQQIRRKHRIDASRQYFQHVYLLVCRKGGNFVVNKKKDVIRRSYFIFFYQSIYRVAYKFYSNTRIARGQCLNSSNLQSLNFYSGFAIVYM